MPAKSLSFAEIWEILNEEGVHPVRGLARIAANNVPCTVCRGKLVTPVNLGEGHSRECFAAATAKCQCGRKHTVRCVDEDECTCKHIGSRACQSCHETGMEAIAPALITRALEALTPLVAASLKQVDNVTSDGSMRPVYAMQIIDSSGRVLDKIPTPGAGKTPPQLMAPKRED